MYDGAPITLEWCTFAKRGQNLICSRQPVPNSQAISGPPFHDSWCRQDMENSLSKIRGDTQGGPTCTWLAADFRSTLATSRPLTNT